MVEKHPYGEYIPKHPRAMIVGSFPIGKFTHPTRRHEIKPHEFDFFFGGEKNLLWKLLGKTFNKNIQTKDDIVRMLEEQGLAIGDVIKSCQRKEGGASDSDLMDISWNTDLISIIEKHNIHTVFFTSRKVERWFNQLFPDTKSLKKICLISPSGQSIRGLARNPEFLKWREKNKKKKTVDFIYEQYKKVFLRFLRE